MSYTVYAVDPGIIYKGQPTLKFGYCQSNRLEKRMDEISRGFPYDLIATREYPTELLAKSVESFFLHITEWEKTTDKAREFRIANDVIKNTVAKGILGYNPDELQDKREKAERESHNLFEGWIKDESSEEEYIEAPYDPPSNKRVRRNKYFDYGEICSGESLAPEILIKLFGISGAIKLSNTDEFKKLELASQVYLSIAELPLGKITFRDYHQDSCIAQIDRVLGKGWFTRRGHKDVSHVREHLCNLRYAINRLESVGLSFKNTCNILGVSKNYARKIQRGYGFSDKGLYLVPEDSAEAFKEFGSISKRRAVEYALSMEFSERLIAARKKRRLSEKQSAK